MHHPEYKWRVYWPSFEPGAARKERRFKSKTAASQFKTAKEVELTNYGREVAALKDRAVEDAVWALKALEPYGTDLRSVVEDYLQRRAASESSRAVADAVEELLEAKTADGLSKRYVGDLRAKLRRFAGDFGSRPLSEIAPAEIGRWLRGLEASATTRNNYRRALTVLFSWGKPLGYCQGNPAQDVPEAKEIEKRVEIYTPEELRLILDHAPGSLLPYLALGAFAGLRSAEIERLDWSQIGFSRGRIEVDATVAKTAAHRYVPIEPALEAWIEPHAQPSGGVAPVNAQRRLWEFRKALAKPMRKGPKRRPALAWKSNALRHSFASYALAREEDAAKVALWLGHTSPSMTFKHYRERVDRESAEAYFSVRPSV